MEPAWLFKQPLAPEPGWLFKQPLAPEPAWLFNQPLVFEKPIALQGTDRFRSAFKSVPLLIHPQDSASI